MKKPGKIYENYSGNKVQQNVFWLFCCNSESNNNLWDFNFELNI